MCLPSSRPIPLHALVALASSVGCEIHRRLCHSYAAEKSTSTGAASAEGGILLGPFLPINKVKRPIAVRSVATECRGPVSQPQSACSPCLARSRVEAPKHQTELPYRLRPRRPSSPPYNANRALSAHERAHPKRIRRGISSQLRRTQNGRSEENSTTNPKERPAGPMKYP